MDFTWLPPFLIPIAFVSGLIFLVVYRYKKVIVIPPVLPTEGIGVPVVNSSRGTLLMNVHNGLYPSLRLFEDHITFCVMSTTSVRFDEINKVGVRKIFWSNSLELSFPDKTFKVYLDMNITNLKAVLKFLQNKGCNLNGEAVSLINS